MVYVVTNIFIFFFFFFWDLQIIVTIMFIFKSYSKLNKNIYVPQIQKKTTSLILNLTFTTTRSLLLIHLFFFCPFLFPHCLIVMLFYCLLFYSLIVILSYCPIELLSFCPFVTFSFCLFVFLSIHPFVLLSFPPFFSLSGLLSPFSPSIIP